MSSIRFTFARTRRYAMGWMISFVVLITAVTMLYVPLVAKDFEMPRAADASSYPAHDYHPMEKVAIAGEPYVGEKGSLFKAKLAEHDIVPLFLVVTNNGSQPVQLSDMEVTLATVDRKAKIRPASEEDLYRRLGKVRRRGDEARRFPIPLPGGGPKVGVKKDVGEELDQARFQARAVEPNSTQSGFLFFDVSGIKKPLQGAKLYITGVKNGSGQELMYFEIPLDKAVQQAP